MLKHEIIKNVDRLPVFFNSYTEHQQLIPSHWHQHIEILYITEGRMEITLNHASHTLVSKDIFVVNSGQIHMTRIHDYAKVLLLQIPIALLRESVIDIESILFTEHISYEVYKQNTSYQALIELLHKMENVYLTMDTGYTLLFNSLLHQFLYYLYSCFSTKQDWSPLIPSDKQLSHLQKAIDYMTEHYNEPITLSNIANHLALNPEYFCRMFKKNMGVSFLMYLNQIRLVHIYEDLKKTNHTITALQQKHGFTNYKVFNRMFKESYGTNPSALKQT